MAGFDEWVTKFNGEIQIVVKADMKTFHEAADELAQTIKFTTPVGDPNLWARPIWPKGYVPGTLKASWETIHDDNKVTIKNETVYAYRIETGWSRIQAPEGMMRVSVEKWPRILETISVKNKL